MASLGFQIVKYQVALGREFSLNVSGRRITYSATIYCSGEDKGGCQIVFVPEGQELPNNRFYPADRFGWLFGRDSQYEWYIDMLRNEKPVFCFLDSADSNQCRLLTGSEPVGEAEINISL